MAQYRRRTKTALFKSFLRVCGYVCLFGLSNTFAAAAASILIVSEILGIYEELE